MKFLALMHFLEEQLETKFLQGNTNPFAKEVLDALVQGCGIGDNYEKEITRAEAANALQAVRTKYRADDAPVEGFRLVERTVVLIDDAFDIEDWQKRKG